VVGWQHRGRGTHYGAQRVVELLGFGLLHGCLECGAGGGFGAVQARDGRVLVEVVMVVGGGAYDGALRCGASVCGSAAISGGGGDGDGEMVGEEAYRLAVHVEVDLWVIWREHAVGGSDDWAGGHGRVCLCVCVYEFECEGYALSVFVCVCRLAVLVSSVYCVGS
jgi:hypothetical protein